MRNASSHQGKNEWQRKKSEQDHFLHKTCNWEVSGSFTLSPCKTKAKKCTKKCAVFAKFFGGAVLVAVAAWLTCLQTITKL